MQINSNIKPVSIPEIAGVQTAPSASKVESATETEFSASMAVESALQRVPEVRPEAVARASKLLEQPGYPPTAIIQGLATLLAQSFEEDE